MKTGFHKNKEISYPRLKKTHKIHRNDHQWPEYLTIIESDFRRISRILQMKEGVIHRVLSPFLKEFRHFALCFSAHQNNTTLSPCFLGQLFNNLQRAALFTFHVILTSSVQ